MTDITKVITTREYLQALSDKGYTVVPQTVKIEDVLSLYAQLDALKVELKSADEGLKLFHSIASNGEQSVLSRLDGKADEVDAQRWQDEQIELAGRSDEAGGESVDVSQYFNGYKAPATKEWRERHLNEGG